MAAGRVRRGEVVFPYDKAVNEAVHAIGSRRRSHCHGACFDFTRGAERQQAEDDNRQGAQQAV